ncbi:MAG TPA: phosphoglycerate mutase [Stenotrophomonas sp.]|nr:phosphoglycerate mutase [Stenotrophomonas sp.]
MATATLLLPARDRLPGTLPAGAVARALARADHRSGQAGERAQLQRHFSMAQAPWPVAALTRQLDAGDAAGASWLRADPAYVVPDMTGARMMAYGEALGLEAEDAAALLPDLRPLFADAGFVLDAPDPARWYLRLSPEAQLPEFAAPEAALGEDLFAHLPQGEAGRRWRALLTESQVVLHQHPWNRQRAARGKPAINSLWFWGGGRLPETVASTHMQVRSRDSLLRALALAAGVDADAAGQVDALVDLRHMRSLQQFDEEVVQPLLQAMARGELDRLVLDFQDGEVLTLTRAQRWRFWRGPRTQLTG